MLPLLKQPTVSENHIYEIANKTKAPHRNTNDWWIDIKLLNPIKAQICARKDIGYYSEIQHIVSCFFYLALSSPGCKVFVLSNIVLVSLSAASSVCKKCQLCIPSMTFYFHPYFKSTATKKCNVMLIYQSSRSLFYFEQISHLLHIQRTHYEGTHWEWISMESLRYCSTVNRWYCQ